MSSAIPCCGRGKLDAHTHRSAVTKWPWITGRSCTMVAAVVGFNGPPHATSLEFRPMIVRAPTIRS
jgi:hypothetical protein